MSETYNGVVPVGVDLGTSTSKFCDGERILYFSSVPGDPLTEQEERKESIEVVFSLVQTQAYGAYIEVPGAGVYDFESMPYAECKSPADERIVGNEALSVDPRCANAAGLMQLARDQFALDLDQDVDPSIEISEVVSDNKM